MDEFKIGDIVKIIRAGFVYTMYEDWVSSHCPQYLCNFTFGKSASPNSIGKIVCIAPHDLSLVGILCGVMIDGQIFIINKEGLEIQNNYVVDLL